jgi:hypothetical protein
MRSMMRKLAARISNKILALCLMSFFLLVPLRLSAQSTASVDYLREYAFIAPTSDTASTGTRSAYAVGGGVEQLLGQLLKFPVGAGADLKALIPGSGKANNTVGIASFNPYIHRWLTPKWDVYVAPGYSLIFRDFTANGWNVGGGFNYWFRENTGLTWEVREEAGKHTPQFVENHYLEIRIGLTFR